MSAKQPKSRAMRRRTLLFSGLILLALAAGTAIVLPLVGHRSLTGEPGAPPTGVGPVTASPTTGSPSTSPSTRPNKTETAKRTKPGRSPSDGGTKTPGAPSAPTTPKGKESEDGNAEPYSGKGHVPAVRTDRGHIDKATALKVVRTYVEAVPKVSAKKRAKEAVANIAGVAIQQELQNQLSELRANGWSLKGQPVVKSASIIKSNLKFAASAVTVKACVDSSSMVTLDHDGKPIGQAAPPAFNIYKLQQQPDGSWLLVSHSFPRNPIC